MNLSNFGFQEVGKCTLDKGLKSGVRFHVVEMRDDRVIYAYIVDGGVKYIGICDSIGITLRDRMSRYQGMTGNGTNLKIALLIKGCLQHGKVVKILAWKPDTEIGFKGLKVDLVKGLENPLIQELRPEWNTKL